MYLRLVVLVGLFNGNLLSILAYPFFTLAIISLGVGWLWSRRPDPEANAPTGSAPPRNPLELGAASLFGFLYLAILIATRLVLANGGDHGMYILSAAMGIVDVDPFILGLTQSAGSTVPMHLAAVAILIAAASNNVVKGCYAYVWADRQTGCNCLLLLAGLGVLGLIPLIWLA
jgi:uncharacterized membrane protein (DUF4010 family)